MRFSPLIAIPLAGFLGLSAGAAIAPEYAIPVTDYDVVIIGGGPSGLSALSGLARVRRNVLLIDSGEYRNADTRRIHDVIALDGIVPAQFRYNARQLISQYPSAHWQNGTVTSVVSTKTGNLTSFLTTDSEGKTYSSRKIVLATGLVDDLPDTPGLAESWARGIFWCVWCDGHEHEDQRLGLLGSLVDIIGSVYESITLNTDIIAFVNGTDTPANEATLEANHPGWRQQLEGYNVTYINDTIVSINRTQDGALVFDPNTGAEYDRFNIVLENGKTIERDAFLGSFPNHQRSYLGKDLGVQYDGDRLSVVTASMRTTIAGVWAVGDANSDNATNVPHAMFSGKKAAVYCHVELEKERGLSYTHTISARDVGDMEGLMGRDLEDLYDGMKKDTT